MISSLISVMVEKSHQPRFSKYPRDDDLFTSKDKNLIAGSGQLDTKEVLRLGNECVENKDCSGLDMFSDRLSDITCHLCNDTDSDDTWAGEPESVSHTDSIEIWNEELQIFSQRNYEYSEENPLEHRPINELREPQSPGYAKDDEAVIGQTKDPPQTFKGWTNVESTLPMHREYGSSFDCRTGGLFSDHTIVPDDGFFATIHIPDSDDFEVNFLTPTVDMDMSESNFDQNIAVGSSPGNKSCLKRITARNISAEHGVISPSSTTSEYVVSQDYTLPFGAKNSILMGCESLSFCTSHATRMAKRPCIEWRQTIVKPNLQFKLCNAIAHKIQDPYNVGELTNNSFLQEQHTEFSINENKYLKNDKVSYAFTNDTMGHTSENSLEKASHETQAFVQKWLDHKDEIIIDCEQSGGIADGRMLSIKRKRLDSSSEQTTKYSGFQEGKIPVSDSTMLFSNYSCEHDRVYLFRSF